MRKILLITIVGLFLGGCAKLPFNQQAQGALQVTGNQPMVVFLNENSLGEAPIFNDHIKTGSYTVRIEPTDKHISSWQTKVSVSANTLTVVDYQAAKSGSSNYVLQLVPKNDQQTHLSLTTLPGNAITKIDAQVKGFSPIAIDDITAGDHTIEISAPGYSDKSLNVKTVAGYNLVVQVELAHIDTNTPVATPEASAEVNPTQTPLPATTSAQLKPTATPTANTLAYQAIDGIIAGFSKSDQLPKPFVKILPASPGINWLRVRKDPSGLTSNEVAKIKVGGYFPFIDVSEDHEWIKIQFGANKTTELGWISAQYGELNQTSQIQ